MSAADHTGIEGIRTRGRAGLRWRAAAAPAALAAFAMLLGLAAVAVASFSAPINLSAPGQNAAYPQVATDADGDAVAVWAGFSGIQARTISAAGARGPIRTLSAPGQAFDPRVASDTNGGGIVVWSQSGIRARTISAAGVLGQTKTLSATGNLPQIATDAGGDAIVAWQRYDGSAYSIQARTVSAAGALGPVKTLAGVGYAVDPEVATDADGDSVAVWERLDLPGERGCPVPYPCNPRVQARTISPAGVLGSVKTLSVGGYGPEIATDPDGDAVAVWSRYEGSGLDRIQARTISAAGALGATKTLSVVGHTDSLPKIASDGDGGAIAVWSRPVVSPTPDKKIEARTISAAGSLGPILAVSRPAQQTQNPQIATDADGDAVAVWSRWDGSHVRVQARSISAAGARGAITTLSAAGGHATGPQIASDAEGDVVAVWSRSGRIQASHGP